MRKVLVATGSNVGDRRDHIERAVRRLGQEISIEAVSHLYETAPMYMTDQPAFLNGALVGSTDLSPLALLRRLKAIEKEIGRGISERNGPREIDLDLVGYGALAYRFCDPQGLKLQIPHPRTPERRFVLQPLADVAPDYLLPGLGIVQDLLRLTEDQADSVHRIPQTLTVQ